MCGLGGEHSPDFKDISVAEENTESTPAPKRRPGRPRKAEAAPEGPASEVKPAKVRKTKPKAAASEAAPAEAEAKPKRTRKPKAPKEGDPAVAPKAEKDDKPEKAPKPAKDKAPKAEKPAKPAAEQPREAAPSADAGQQAPAGEEGSFKRRRQRNRKGDASAEGSNNNGGQSNGQNAGQGNQNGGQGYQGRQRDRQARPGRGAQNQQNNRRQFAGNNNNNRRRNRHNNNGGGNSQLVMPRLSREDLQQMLVAELRHEAAGLGVEYVGVRKADLVEAVYVASARAEGFREAAGVLDIANEGYGFVRTANYMAGDDDAFVPQQLIKHLGLRRGDWIEGTVRPSRPNDKYPALQKVSSVNGLPPEAIRSRPRFRDLTPVYPNERLRMEHGKDSITGRAIDLVAPIGKGQRGLIVSPPKAGKTTVLKRVCESIAANNPEVYLICLLVDERPEEVTDMQRSIKGDVVASTFDMPAENHTTVSELVIERAKRLVEMGRDVVVVLDSITRLARAYNLAAPASGRILSGGVDSAALYPPKKFLGAARNIENGGSLTILASALVETGSKMDEVIFEEFKGTGNMELKLDRELADKRIFPAIDPVASGTRNEELLIDADLQPFVWGIRRVLANMNNIERAEASLIKGLRATATNEEFLIRSAKKAQLTDYNDPA